VRPGRRRAFLRHPLPPAHSRGEVCVAKFFWGPGDVPAETPCNFCSLPIVSQALERPGGPSEPVNRCCSFQTAPAQVSAIAPPLFPPLPYRPRRFPARLVNVLGWFFAGLQLYGRPSSPLHGRDGRRPFPPAARNGSSCHKRSWRMPGIPLRATARGRSCSIVWGIPEFRCETSRESGTFNTERFN